MRKPSYEDRLAVYTGLRIAPRERSRRSGRGVWDAVVVGLMAVLFLAVGVNSAVNSLLLAVRGEVTDGTVVAVPHGSRSDFVRVRLESPVNREVRLRAWAGEPKLGTVLRVRYDRGNPSRAMDARVWVSWYEVGFGFGAGVLLAVQSWRSWSGRGWFSAASVWRWWRRRVAAARTGRS